jgi:Na+/H+ antiporter NhaD/arsenite permease-like protein
LDTRLSKALAPPPKAPTKIFIDLFSECGGTSATYLEMLTPFIALGSTILAAAETIAAIIFSITVAAIVLRVVDESVAGLTGLIAMIVFTKYGPLEAFRIIDWNVIAILLGMWVITGYMIEGGFAEAVVSLVAKRVKSYRKFLLAMAILAGFVSIFVDNVLVILLFGSIVLEAARRAGGNPVLAILLIGFSANFMGTALLMGDLPPQLLHSIAGAEFLDFIWSHGRPSSFPLLTATFLLVIMSMYMLFVAREPESMVKLDEAETGSQINKAVLTIGLAGFIATVIGMAIRPLLGVPLGFITIAGAAITSLIGELYNKASAKGVSFEKALEHVEWRALFFYASLFGLVGGLEVNHVLRSIAEHFVGFIEASPYIAYTVFYWLVALLATIIEHDALLLTFLYLVRDAATLSGVNAWPLYWGMAWSATLASNLTVAAAPALYVAVAMAEKSGYKVTPKTFLKYSVPFVLLSLIIQYVLSMPIWAPLMTMK